MRIAFIARSTLFDVHGGITVQVQETARHLRAFGVDVTIYLADETINYESYDLLHFFDITRPANILYHIRKSRTPCVLTPILIDYSEYDRHHRSGLSGFVFQLFNPDTNEYIKAISKWLLGNDRLQSKDYIWKGHRRATREVLGSVQMILPNSAKEQEQLQNVYRMNRPFSIIPNGINEQLFTAVPIVEKDDQLVICAARIEGLKNQLNLIKALNDTPYRLLLIGDPSPNQLSYYRHCRSIAGKNIQFIGRVSQDVLAGFYAKAKVHVLPSWFETCGLSSLEAGFMGCNIVVTDKGFTRDYFGTDAFYCNPADPGSIFQAIQLAAQKGIHKNLQERIGSQFTWKQTAIQTLAAYHKVLQEKIVPATPLNYAS